jgi:hypothetical protein
MSTAASAALIVLSDHCLMSTTEDFLHEGTFILSNTKTRKAEDTDVGLIEKTLVFHD